MARIIDETDYWKLEIFPEATVVRDEQGQIDKKMWVEEPTKGHRALLGYDNLNNRHVIMYVWYKKDKYSIGDVLSKIDGMKNCPRCDTLDRERLNDVSIESAGSLEQHRPNVSGPVSSQVDQGIPSYPGGPAFIKDSAVERTSNVKDMFTNALFDAYLTPAGKMLMGNVFGDESLAQEAFPKTPDEMARLWEDSTAGKFLRSPEEAKEFISVIKGDDDETVPSGSKNSKKVTHGFVVY